MAKPGSDRDGAMVDKQAGKKSKDKISPFTKTPKLDRSDLLGKEGKPKSSMKRKLSFTASPPRGEERDSDTDDSDPGQSGEPWGERLAPLQPCRIYADKEGPDKKKVKKEAGSKKSASAHLLFGYPLSERKQMALLMQMTARDNSPDSTPSHPSPAATALQRKLPSSTASRQRDKVNKRNERGETPLHMAAIRGDAKQVKELISLGADVNVKDFAGWTPLHEACNLGYYDVAKVLLAAGAEVNTQGLDDDTPLHDASSSGHKNILKLLLRHGGNAFQANKRGERPVDVADSLELERLLKGEAAPSDSDDSSSESEDPPSVNPSSLDDDNMDDSDADNKDPDDKRAAAAAAKASSSTSGLDEYEFKDEEEEEEDDEEEEEDVLSKALGDRHTLRREGKPRGEEAGPGADRERGRNHFAAKQDGGGSGKPKKPRVPPRARCCGGTDSSSDETETPAPERRSSPTCSHGPPDPRGRKENPVLLGGVEQPRDKGKVKRKSKSLSKNKENQEDGKENSKALGFSSSVAAGNDTADRSRDDDSFKMSFSPKDDASVHLFHLASAKSPKLNHQGAADNKPPTPLKQENAKACGGGGGEGPLDGAKYNHYGAEQDYCTTEGSSSKGCKHKEKSKHHQKDGEEDAASPYKDAGVANSVDGGGGEGAMRKTDKDGKVVKKHKLKHKEKDKHRRDYEVQDRNRHRPPKDAARRDGQNRNLEFDREFWKENFFKSDENDEPSPPPPAAVKKEPDDAGSSTPKHAAVADAASSPAKEERAARDKHTGAKEKRPREEQRERDRGAKKERREERGKEARPAAEPDAGRTPEEATPKDEPEERPVAEQDQPDTYEKVPARERYDKRLPDRKEPEKPERRHPDKDRKVKAEHTADLPQNLPERLREKERERGGGGASHSPADRSHREAEKPRSASATKKNEENRRTKEKRGGGGEEQHREKDRPKDRKLPERPERPREKDCDKKRREKTKEASASSASSSNLKLLLEERRGYAPAPARAREDATAAARTPEKERRDRDADRYREREKERYRERSQQGKAAKPKPAEADGTPADRAKSKASPATPRGDPRPKEKRLVNDDLMQTSFERMLSLKDQEIEQWHRKHLEKIKQKERERLKQQRPSPAPPAAAVDPARVRSRDRAARPEPPPCAAAAGKELLRSRSSEGPETPGREKAAARDATGNRTLSLDSRSLSVLGGGRLPAGAENSLSRSPRPEGERSSDLMSRSVSMVSVASSDDSCRATTPTPTRPPEYDSDLTLEAGGDSQLPSFLQTSSVLSLHTATRSPVVHDRDGAPLPDAAAAQCGRTPLPSRLASPYLRAILDEDAKSPSVVEGKPFDVLPKAPPGGEEPADFPRAAPPPEVSADPEETPPCGRGSTPPAVPPSARPDVDAVVIPESAASVPVPTVLPPPLSDAKDSTRPLPAGQSQAGIPQLAGVEPTGPLTSDPPVTLEVRCLPTDVPDGASKELPSVETPLLTAACLTAPPPAPSSNARAPAPTFRQPSEAPLSTEAPQAEAGLDLREKNPLDGAGAENLAVPESVWGSSRTERTSSPVPSSSAAAGRTPSEEEPGQGRTGAEPADPREDADDGTRFRPAGDATDIRADPPTDKSEHVRPSSSSASSSASPERRAEETADAPQSAEITTGDAETPTTMTPAAADKESSSMETAPDMAEPPCPEPMEASSSADDGPEPTPGAGESGQSAAAAPPPVDMSGGSASGSSSPQSGDRDSDSSGAKAKAARSPSDEDADMQVAAHPRKRKMPRASPPSSSSSSSSSSSQACLTAPPDKDTPQQSLAAIVDSVKLEEIEPYQTERANPYYDFLHIRRKIEEKRKFLLSVIPQPPQFYDEYVTFNGSYLIDGNPLSKLCIPTITPPPSLPEQLKEMFKQQEVVRMKLRLQHSIEREKLIVSNEQEILRVHYRAARTLANQTLPFSACTVLLDAEVYNMPQDVQASGMMSHSVESGDDGKTSVRDRFNARQFMSWLQDVDDKFDKLKTCLLMRQQHEAAALNAVQRLEWQLKQQELDPALYKATSIFDISEFYIPLVEVNDDFDLTPI